MWCWILKGEKLIPASTLFGHIDVVYLAKLNLKLLVSKLAANFGTSGGRSV